MEALNVINAETSIKFSVLNSIIEFLKSIFCMTLYSLIRLEVLKFNGRDTLKKYIIRYPKAAKSETKYERNLNGVLTENQNSINNGIFSFGARR